MPSTKTDYDDVTHGKDKCIVDCCFSRWNTFPTVLKMSEPGQMTSSATHPSCQTLNEPDRLLNNLPTKAYQPRKFDFP